METALWIIAIILILANLDLVLSAGLFLLLAATVLAGLALLLYAVVTWPAFAVGAGVLLVIGIVASDISSKHG